MREQVCCFTGHRRIPQNELKGIEERLEATITKLYSRGVVYYGAGGALGFDTLAAETVLRHRFIPEVVYKSLLNPDIPFVDLLYEASSAFGTAGLTAGVTTRLEPISRLITCVTMFIGRVGPLSFGLSILMRSRSDPAILPQGRMLIG